MCLNGLLGTKAGRESWPRLPWREAPVSAPPVWEDCWDSFLVPRRHGTGHEALPRHPLSQDEAASAPRRAQSCHQRCDKAARWWIQNTDGTAAPWLDPEWASWAPGGVAISADRCPHRRAFLSSSSAEPSSSKLQQPVRRCR